MLHNNPYRENIIGDYLIKETIGEGAFSKVKIGIHQPTKKKFAIKIIQKSKLDSNDQIRIEREMSILTSLNHPNVIQVNEIFEDHIRYFIVMEYCKGGELFNHIVKKKKLSEEDSSIYFYQIINGIDYLHQETITHRDLKPENILLYSKKMIKIIDFGLSNYLDDQSLLFTPCGSPCYASPEMIKGYKYDGRMIDIWSVGIILFAMISGYLPFEDKTNTKLFAKIVKGKIDYPKHMSEIAKNLIKSMLTVNPDERIKIVDIRRHQFYLKGMTLYNQYQNMSPTYYPTEESKTMSGNLNGFNQVIRNTEDNIERFNKKMIKTEMNNCYWMQFNKELHEKIEIAKEIKALEDIHLRTHSHTNSQMNPHLSIPDGLDNERLKTGNNNNVNLNLNTVANTKVIKVNKTLVRKDAFKKTLNQNCITINDDNKSIDSTDTFKATANRLLKQQKNYKLKKKTIRTTQKDFSDIERSINLNLHTSRNPEIKKDYDISENPMNKIKVKNLPRTTKHKRLNASMQICRNQFTRREINHSLVIEQFYKKYNLYQTPNKVPHKTEVSNNKDTRSNYHHENKKRDLSQNDYTIKRLLITHENNQSKGSPSPVKQLSVKVNIKKTTITKRRSDVAISNQVLQLAKTIHNLKEKLYHYRERSLVPFQNRFSSEATKQ